MVIASNCAEVPISFLKCFSTIARNDEDFISERELALKRSHAINCLRQLIASR